MVKKQKDHGGWTMVGKEENGVRQNWKVNRAWDMGYEEARRGRAAIIPSGIGSY